eukprot:TRINITY_DN116570_c0_g1_i1.p1 TRINITY_DN116570_c0_g1~~TRINITY_DN116570_c0_g1_i1.p1  ORF type:complete len:196 (+),score=13.65 TRINITY_DN116570_c0_g1_i1:50-589(+)
MATFLRSTFIAAFCSLQWGYAAGQVQSAAWTLMEVNWSPQPGCGIDTSLEILNVTGRASKSGLLKYDAELTYHFNVTRTITKGTIEYPLIAGGIQWKGTTADLCSSPSSCPLKIGTATVVVTVSAMAGTEYGPGDVTSNGYTPDFQGLRVLACASSLAFRTPSLSETSGEAVVEGFVAV